MRKLSQDEQRVYNTLNSKEKETLAAYNASWKTGKERVEVDKALDKLEAAEDEVRKFVEQHQ